MTPSVLIDSSALLAMLDAGDKHHTLAASFARDHKSALFYLPETVFIETMVLVKARLGAQPSIELGTRLTSSTRFAVLPRTQKERPPEY